MRFRNAEKMPGEWVMKSVVVVYQSTPTGEWVATCWLAETKRIEKFNCFDDSLITG